MGLNVLDEREPLKIKKFHGAFDAMKGGTHKLSEGKKLILALEAAGDTSKTGMLRRGERGPTARRGGRAAGPVQAVPVRPS